MCVWTDKGVNEQETGWGEYRGRMRKRSRGEEETERERGTEENR